jgi:hypothetical protein
MWASYKAAYAERIEADEEAMPAYWAAIGEKEPDGSGGEIVLAYPADDGNDGEAARTECNQYINDAMLNERVRLRLVPLFTHPPAQAAQPDGSGRVPDGLQQVFAIPGHYDWADESDHGRFSDAQKFLAGFGLVIAAPSAPEGESHE